MRALLRRNFYLEENRRITDRLRSRELEAARALVEKRAAEDRARLADKLEATNRDLEAANKELEAFCYSVSHDLRSPLRTIDGFSLALLEDYGEKLDEGGRDCLNRVRAGCLRMAQLIDDLLGLSNVTRREFYPGKVDLSKTAEDVIRTLRDGDRERSFAVGIQPGLTVRGDHGLLKVLLENLLGNAWKFTTKTSEPEIRFGFKKDRGEYFVEDNGAGFDMAYAKKLFGAFQRLHSQEEFPGTGIGLATVQRVVHRHGGRIRAEGAPGKGAAFYFTLNAEGAGDER
jgi:light-regulated signal transduction histidine kinase (bacteriophytochrome)